jgi:hypothetical protein
MKKQAKKRVKKPIVAATWTLEQEVAHLKERWVVAQNEAVSQAALAEVLKEKLANAENLLRIERQVDENEAYVARRVKVRAKKRR